MEILQCTLDKSDLEKLSAFQLKVWNTLNSLLKNLIFDKLSEESVVEMGGIGIDVLLRLKTNSFVLYMSIQEDSLVLNSEHFDIYVYSETEIGEIEHLLKQVLLGEYSINLRYGVKRKLIKKELVFNDENLKEFNESHRFFIFKKNIKDSQILKGIKLIHS